MGLIKSRKVTDHTDNFLFPLALKFVDVPTGEFSIRINAGLQELLEYLSADRCYIYMFIQDQKKLILTDYFYKKGLKNKIPQHDRVDNDDFAWLIHSLRNGTSVTIASADKLPAKASTIKAIMEAEKSKSMILCPLIHSDDVIGCIGMDIVSEPVKFSEDTQKILERSATIFAAAIKRRELEKTGQLAEYKFKSLFNNIEDPIFISTPEGNFLDINSAGVKLFGFESVDEMLTVNIKEELYLNPEDREEYKKALEIRGRIKDYELVLKNKEGKKLTVLETSSIVEDSEGKIVAYSGIIRDVTHKRRWEQQFFQAQKMESIGLMAGGVAHDFNNILTTITGYAELMMMTMDESHPNYKDVTNIIQGGKRAENLVRQLLAFSSRQMIQPKIIDINKVITELHAMLSRLIEEDIKFELKLHENLALIKADPVQIQQVLVNLVVNAGHAIKEQKDRNQGKIIRITTDAVKLTSEFVDIHPGSREGDFILICVEDTGIGMSEKTRQRIFEPFFSTKGKGEGTGLGLSTVYGIIKQNNSNIYVDSEPGAGSAFKIYWPVSKEEKSDETRIEIQIDTGPRTETILYVEDDIHVRDMAVDALKTFGYKVFEAENGRHALEIIKKEYLIDKIDMVVSDIVMPEMSGEELAETIRKLNPKIHILLCSGYTNSRIYIRENFNLNGCHFLAKPFTMQKLEKKIRSILSNADG